MNFKIFICYIKLEKKVLVYLILCICLHFTYDHRRKKYNSVKESLIHFQWKEAVFLDRKSGHLTLIPSRLVTWSGQEVRSFHPFFCRASHVEGQEVMSCNFVSSLAGIPPCSNDVILSCFLPVGHLEKGGSEVIPPGFPAGKPCGEDRK